MKKQSCNPFNWLVLSSVLMLLAGCGGGVDKVDFTLNGEKAANIDLQNDADTAKAFKIFVGDTIHFLDASLPEGSAKTFVWSLTKDSIEVNNAVNNNPVTKGFDEAGLYQMRLRVNDEENGAMKMVLVQDRPMPLPNSLPESPPIAETPIYVPPPTSPKKPSGGGSASAPARDVVAVTPQPTPPTNKPSAPIVEPTPPAKTPPPPVSTFRRPNTISALFSNHPTKTDCAAYTATSFSVTLKPTQRVQLGSFRIFHDTGGSLNLSIKGGDVNETGSVALSGRASQISFEALDSPVLEAGVTYILTGTTAKSSDKQPRLEDTNDCNLSPKTSPLLEIDQHGHLFIYELKFQN
jgi:hypothetical protein